MTMGARLEWCSLDSPEPVRPYSQILPRAATHQRICSPGKTTFLKFLLVWLISAHQVVLLCDNLSTYLFYQAMSIINQRALASRALLNAKGDRIVPYGC